MKSRVSQLDVDNDEVYAYTRFKCGVLRYRAGAYTSKTDPLFAETRATLGVVAPTMGSDVSRLVEFAVQSAALAAELQRLGNAEEVILQAGIQFPPKPGKQKALLLFSRY